VSYDEEGGLFRNSVWLRHLSDSEYGILYVGTVQIWEENGRFVIRECLFKEESPGGHYRLLTMQPLDLAYLVMASKKSGCYVEFFEDVSELIRFIYDSFFPYEYLVG
jgi:hypothetical protein